MRLEALLSVKVSHDTQTRTAEAEAALQQPTEETDRLDDTVQIVPRERSAWGSFVGTPTASDDDDESDDASDSTCTTQWTEASTAQRASRKVLCLTLWSEYSLPH